MHENGVRRNDYNPESSLGRNEHEKGDVGDGGGLSLFEFVFRPRPSRQDELSIKSSSPDAQKGKMNSIVYQTCNITMCITIRTTIQDHFEGIRVS